MQKRANLLARERCDGSLSRMARVRAARRALLPRRRMSAARRQRALFNESESLRVGGEPVQDDRERGVGQERGSGSWRLRATKVSDYAHIRLSGFPIGRQSGMVPLGAAAGNNLSPTSAIPCSARHDAGLTSR